jgi:hypothetical protein
MRLYRITHPFFDEPAFPDRDYGGIKHFATYQEAKVALRTIKLRYLQNRIRSADRTIPEVDELIVISGRDAMVSMLNGDQPFVLTERNLSGSNRNSP